MYSNSLGKVFAGVSSELDLAEGYAYNGCLSYANTHRSIYKEDCTTGYRVVNGYYVIEVSPPVVNGEWTAWGLGWAGTAQAATSNALYWCRYYGGNECEYWGFGYNDPGGGPTSGGEW